MLFVWVLCQLIFIVKCFSKSFIDDVSDSSTQMFARICVYCSSLNRTTRQMCLLHISFVYFKRENKQRFGCNLMDEFNNSCWFCTTELWRGRLRSSFLQRCWRPRWRRIGRVLAHSCRRRSLLRTQSHMRPRTSKRGPQLVPVANKPFSLSFALQLLNFSWRIKSAKMAVPWLMCS